MIRDKWDLKDRRIARMSVIKVAFDIAKHNSNIGVIRKPISIDEVKRIAEELLEWIYTDDREYEEQMKKEMEKLNEDENLEDLPW